MKKKIRKPASKGICNDIGDSIVFRTDEDGVVVFSITVSEPDSENLCIEPSLARKMAADLIKMADWLEQTGRA